MRLSLPVIATLIAAMTALALPDTGQAQRRPSETVNYAYADVLRVDPVYEVVRFTEPSEECYDEELRVRERDSGAGGTVLGAIVGGVIGSNVGSGAGRRAATAAGAVVGGAIGHNIDKNNGGEREYTERQHRCRIVDVEREERRVAGYDVEYQYKGDVYFSRMAYDPGSKLRVRVSVEPADS
ncbi:MAG TPA: glycine zipper 2TM domain-containing protein [Xanthomonadaceae bacterium]|nr:glycine zipper 2TM domain-containing protein [Xanthomonadaceae bacterium]